MAQPMTTLSVNEPVYVDNSLLSAVARCSTEALVRHALGYTSTEERATLRAGTALHEALAVWFKGGTYDAAMAAFDASYRVWAEAEVAGDDRLSYANTSRIVAYWLETHPLSALPFVVRPELVEVGVAHPLTDDGDIVFCGRLDAGVDYTDSLYIVEHKSTGRVSPLWLRGWRLDSQPTGYIWLAEQHVAKPVTGVIINALEFSRLPSSDKRCTRHAVPYEECGHLHATFDMVVVTRTPEQLAEWRKTAIHLAKRYRDLLTRFGDLAHVHKVRMQGMFNKSCGWCAFFDWCSMGRPPEYVAGNLVYDPWRPYDFAAGNTAHKP